jgi:hypothetical protein
VAYARGGGGEMIVGCYLLDLYCDNPDCSHRKYVLGRVDDAPNPYAGTHMDFAGRNKTDCLRQARQAGWGIGSRRQLCPECMQKGRQ